MKLSFFLSFIQLHRQHLKKNTFIGIGLIFVIFAINISLGMLLFTTQLTPPDQDLGNATAIIQQSPSIYLLLGSLVFSGVVEEIVFRGMLLQKLKEYKGSVLAIVGSGVLFGIAHIFYGQYLVVATSTLVGLLLGYAVIRTKSLVTSITAHTGYNLLMLTIMML